MNPPVTVRFRLEADGIVEGTNAILREQPIAPSEYNSDAVAVEKIILTCLKKDPAGTIPDRRGTAYRPP